MLLLVAFGAAGCFAVCFALGGGCLLGFAFGGALCFLVALFAFGALLLGAVAGGLAVFHALFAALVVALFSFLGAVVDSVGLVLCAAGVFRLD